MHRATTGRCFQAEVLDYGEWLWSEQTCLTWTFQSCGDAEALGVAVEEVADRDWGSVIARDGGPSVCSESKAAWGPARRQSGGDTVTHSPKCSAKGRSNPEQRGERRGSRRPHRLREPGTHGGTRSAYRPGRRRPTGPGEARPGGQVSFKARRPHREVLVPPEGLQVGRGAPEPWRVTGWRRTGSQDSPHPRGPGVTS